MSVQKILIKLVKHYTVKLRFKIEDCIIKNNTKPIVSVKPGALPVKIPDSETLYLVHRPAFLFKPPVIIPYNHKMLDRKMIQQRKNMMRMMP